MKKLDRLILKSFIGPLLLTFAIAVFVLLMQFVWKYIDDLVGKGLDFFVIAKLMAYASATFVPMALPISVLFASIMTMGNFGEKYELVAMKAGGVSLRRVMRPMVVVTLLLTGVAFYFANNVLPYAMLQYRTILYDVSRKKPAINIRPSEYYTDIENYVIRVDAKDPDGSTLHHVTIYDHSRGPLHSNIIVADNGKMQSSADDRYLFFTLNDGCIYSQDAENEDHYTRPLTRVEFSQQVLTFDISSFAFSESDANFFSGSYQMLNVSQLREAIPRLEESSLKKNRDQFKSLMGYYRGLRTPQTIVNDTLPQPSVALLPDSGTIQQAPITGRPIAIPQWANAHAPLPADCPAYNFATGLSSLDTLTRRRILLNAISGAHNQINIADMNQQLFDGDHEWINRHYIEMHRKFTLSVACLLLFLVGAPFGSLVRRGGLGMPLVASVGFFVLYYVIGMICEKAVRESALPPIGMWVSSFVMLPVGIILTFQATTDRNLAVVDWFIKLNNIRNKKNTTNS